MIDYWRNRFNLTSFAEGYDQSPPLIGQSGDAATLILAAFRHLIFCSIHSDNATRGSRISERSALRRMFASAFTDLRRLYHQPRILREVQPDAQTPSQM